MKMRRWKKKHKWALAASLLGAALLLAGTNSLLNQSFYFPKNQECAVTPLKASLSLLAPSVQSAHVAPDLGFPHLFSASRLRFSFSKRQSAYLPIDTPVVQDEGKISFLFGKAGSSYVDSLGLGKLTYPQSFFMASQETVSWESLQPRKYYEAFLGFSGPLSLREAIDTYPKLFYTGINGNQEQAGGVLWAAMKTSDSPEALCLGACGSCKEPLSEVVCLESPGESHSLVDGGAFYAAFPPEEGESQTTAALMLEHFQAVLAYAAEHQEEAAIYLNCGLFPGGEELRFQERLNYLEQNGPLCLGLAVIAQGETLLSYRGDPGLALLSAKMEPFVSGSSL